jgi:hypothetical protein
MKVNLPSKVLKLAAQHKTQQTLNKFLKVSLFTLVVCFSTAIYSQNSPEFIQEWQPLEEAEFHFDVSYAVVKCSPSSNAVVLLNAFNESGAHPKIGFTLDLTDASGNKAQVTIPLFSTQLGDMMMSSCESDVNSNLKFEVPAGINAATMKIDITYNTGS